MNQFVITPTLPFGPPITEHFIPNSDLNQQAAQVLAEVIKETANLLSQLRPTKTQAEAINLVKLDDKELRDFANYCLENLRLLQATDDRREALQVLATSAERMIEYRNSTAAQRAELAARLPHNPQSSAIERGLAAASAPQTVLGSSGYDPALFRKSASELYQQETKLPPSLLEHLAKTKVDYLNSSGSNWSDKFRNQQITALATQLLALQGTPSVEQVEKIIGSINEPWRKEVQTRLQDLALQRSAQQQSTPSQIPLPEAAPNASKDSPTPKKTGDKTRNTDSKGNSTAGKIQRPDYKELLPPMPPLVTPIPTPIPSDTRLPADSLATGDNRRPIGRPQHETDKISDRYTGQTIREPAKSEVLVHIISENKPSHTVDQQQSALATSSESTTAQQGNQVTSPTGVIRYGIVLPPASQVNEESRQPLPNREEVTAPEQTASDSNASDNLPFTTQPSRAKPIDLKSPARARLPVFSTSPATATRGPITYASIEQMMARSGAYGQYDTSDGSIWVGIPDRPLTIGDEIQIGVTLAHEYAHHQGATEHGAYKVSIDYLSKQLRRLGHKDVGPVSPDDISKMYMSYSVFDKLAAMMERFGVLDSKSFQYLPGGEQEQRIIRDMRTSNEQERGLPILGDTDRIASGFSRYEASVARRKEVGKSVGEVESLSAGEYENLYYKLLIDNERAALTTNPIYGKEVQRELASMDSPSFDGNYARLGKELFGVIIPQTLHENMRIIAKAGNLSEALEVGQILVDYIGLMGVRHAKPLAEIYRELADLSRKVAEQSPGIAKPLSDAAYFEKRALIIGAQKSGEERETFVQASIDSLADICQQLADPNTANNYITRENINDPLERQQLFERITSIATKTANAYSNISASELLKKIDAVYATEAEHDTGFPRTQAYIDNADFGTELK